MTQPEKQKYVLHNQVGYLIRRANQRHLGIFANQIGSLTPTQFSALIKLCELGEASQNALGRETAMDAATIKGVVDRLQRKGLIDNKPDPNDARRLLLKPTAAAWKSQAELIEKAQRISNKTLAPLSKSEQDRFLFLLNKII